MELTDEIKDTVLTDLVKDFWPDIQESVIDIIKDMANKVKCFDETHQLCFIMQAMTFLFALETTRLTCFLDHHNQDFIWEEMKNLSDDKRDEYKKLFNMVIKDQIE